MYYISDMIDRVDDALACGKNQLARITIVRVYEVLSRLSYFQEVFNGDEDDEEWKTRKALRDGLYKLMHPEF